MITRWMIASLLFSSFLAIAAWRGDALLRALGRQTRHVWVAALLACVAWTAAAPVLFTGEPASMTSPLVVSTTILAPAPVASTLSAEATSPTWSVEQLAIAAWATLSVLLLARLVVAIIGLVRLRRAAVREVVDGHDVLITDDVGPAVVGGQRGEIFIPKWLLQLDPALRALVFRHEQEHRAARDPFVLWLSLVTTALLPWNLPLWFIARRLRLSLEIDCDVRTLAVAGDADRYAKLLLLIAHHRPHLPFASTLAGNQSGLSRRIAHMTQNRSPISKSGLVFSALVVTLAVVAACSTRIANVTSPNAANANAAADAGTTAVASPSTPRDSTNKTYFDFQLDKPATVAEGTRVEYPAGLREAGVTGTVLVQVIVDERGMPDMGTFMVLKSDDEAFTQAVRKALETTRFHPAEVQGKPVRQLLQLPFGFRLNGETGMQEATLSPQRRAAPTGAVLPTRRPAKVYNPSSTAPYFDFQVDKPAMALQGVFPAYPPNLRAQKVEGQVLAQFVVDEQGVVDASTIKILRTDDAAFSEAVIAALPKMSYTPAEVGGHKVKQLVQQPFGFTLNK